MRARRGGRARSFAAQRQWCGDGRVDPAKGESCDGANFDGRTCESFGLQSGRLACTDACATDFSGCDPPRRPRCGDGVLDAGEECDGAPAGVTCETFQYAGGLIGCTPDCRLDSSRCEVPPLVACGNGRRDTGEICDGDDLGGVTCPNGGTLRCIQNCRAFDSTACFACGNGRRELPEQCDGADFGGQTCESLGDAGGQLSCARGCTVDRSLCWQCGNARLDPGEQCDDGNSGSGDGCSAECVSECGDGVVQHGEECDDGNRIDGDGCSGLCGREQVSGGGGGEPHDSCMLDWAVEGAAAAERIVCQDGGAPCDRDDVVGACTFLVFHCFNASPIVIAPSPCAPTDVARVELVGASLAGDTALDPAAQEAVLEGFTTTLTRWGGAAVSREGVSLGVSPPATAPRICGSFQLGVPAGLERTVDVAASSSVAVFDVDRLTFACTPAPPPPTTSSTTTTPESTTTSTAPIESTTSAVSPGAASAP